MAFGAPFTDTRAVVFCGVGTFTAMLLVCFASGTSGTAASFGVFAVAVNFGPVTIIDCIRTTMWDNSVFGTAYALKVTMNNAYVAPRPPG